MRAERLATRWQLTLRMWPALQPNYLRVWAGLFALVIYARPAAIIGVAAAVGVTYLNLGLSSGSYQLDPEVCLIVPRCRHLCNDADGEQIGRSSEA